MDVFSLLDNSLKNQREILSKLNTLLVDCTQDLYHHNISFEDAELLERLLIQVVFHNSSILRITDGSSLTVRGKKLFIQDKTAMYSLARLQIETYTNLSYLYFLNCEFPPELRRYIYKIHGLRKQISLTKRYPKEFPEISEMRQELAKEIWKIRKLNAFKMSSSSKKKD